MYTHIYIYIYIYIYCLFALSKLPISCSRLYQYCDTFYIRSTGCVEKATQAMLDINVFTSTTNMVTKADDFIRRPCV